MTVAIAIIVVNVAVSLAGFQALPRLDGAGERFLFIPYQVAQGKNGLGMLLAHCAHGSWLHLGFNMFALYTFAGTVLGTLGSLRFLLVYVVAGIGSDLLVFALHKADPSYRCLGASGSVFGIVMAAVVLDPNTSIMFVFVPVPVPGPVFMLGYGLVAMFLISRKHRGGTSHEGHLGGAMIGLALTALLSPRGLDPLFRWFTQWV